VKTIPNSNPTVQTTVTLITPYAGACPHSGEPQLGSTISIEYAPADRLLELHAVAEWIAPFSAGDEAIDLETVAQRCAVAAAQAVGVPVVVIASYILRNGVRLVCQCRS
jgi:NADPH-dependent 7-cyano-7-deazaguanine reductase QueF